jgi:hypothetical protein
VRRVVALFTLGLAAGACAPKTRQCVTFRSPLPAPPGGVQVTFLGVGGVLVRWGGASLMTGPLYSNPSVPEMAFSDIHSDFGRVDALLREDVSDARAILVGHPHYDHAMDVPFVALNRAKSADILGNAALKKILAPIENDLARKQPPTQLISLEGQDPCTQSHRLAGTRFAVRALRSEHSPQAGPGLVKHLFNIRELTLWRGEPQHPLTALPTRVGGWPAGTTLAFLIDLLEPDSDAIAFRVYYQDSPTRAGVGYPPPCLGDRKVDLAILTVAGASELPGFPADIVGAMKPQFVMGVHWEDFFAPRKVPVPGAADVPEEIWPAPGVGLSAFLRKARQAQPDGGQASIPCPEETTHFVHSGSAWTIARTDADWSSPKP